MHCKNPKGTSSSDKSFRLYDSYSQEKRWEHIFCETGCNQQTSEDAKSRRNLVHVRKVQCVYSRQMSTTQECTENLKVPSVRFEPRTEKVVQFIRGSIHCLFGFVVLLCEWSAVTEKLYL